MAKRRKLALAPPRPTSLTSPHISPGGRSDYMHFLDTYIAGAGTGKDKAALARPKVRVWQDAPADDTGRIVNEIARKFNSSNTKGIATSSYKAGGPNSSSFYGVDVREQPNLTLRPRHNIKDGPNPIVVGHELIHANDHQSTDPADRLNPHVWTNLAHLVQTGNGGRPMADFNQFNASLGNIQDKIDVPGDFKANYPFDRAYIEHEITGARGGGVPYTTPLVGAAGSAPDWPQLFNRINDVVTHVSAPGTPPNQGFYLNRASEFPAFMSENLTRNWDASDRRGVPGAASGPNALSLPEARFLHSTLGNMETAYPSADYPTMNSYIGQRRNSLEHAYYPPSPANGADPAIPAGPPEGGFSRGGRVAGKNLLSRFKKTH